MCLRPQPSSTSIQVEYAIRKARPDDVLHLASIERSAGQLFRTVGLNAIADDDPMPADVLLSYLGAGNLWVATTIENVTENVTTSEAGLGEVVAFLAAFPLIRSTSKIEQSEMFLHIAELSVHASHQRRGLASRLLRHLDEEVRLRKARDEKSIAGLSLTTYRDLAFNGPFYARYGFQEISSDDIEGVVGKRGRDLWDEEQEKIVAPERRCWMVRRL